MPESSPQAGLAWSSLPPPQNPPGGRLQWGWGWGGGGDGLSLHSSSQDGALQLPWDSGLFWVLSIALVSPTRLGAPWVREKAIFLPDTPACPPWGKFGNP